MKLPIPSDWDGQTWQCIEVQWPQSQSYNALLLGLLSLMTRGRLWDEDTGTITDMQAVAWQVFEANYPLVPCAGTEPPEPPEPPENGTSEPTYSAVGIESALGDEDMGQVVTDVTIEDGVIYVYFGPCCKRALGGIPELQAGSQGEVPPTIWEQGGNTPTYSACGKAYAIQYVINKIIEASFSAASAQLPWDMVGYVEDAVGYNLDDNWLVLLLANVSISVAGGATWADVYDAVEQQRIRAKLLEKFADDDGEGVATSEDFEGIKQIFKSEIYPDPRWQYWDQAINALGRADMDTIAKLGATDTTQDCDSPIDNPEVYFGTVTWPRNYVQQARCDGVYTLLARLNNGLTLQHRFDAAAGNFPALGQQWQFDVQYGTSVTEIVVACEALTPADELLHNAWHAADCAHIDVNSEVGTFNEYSSGGAVATKVVNGILYKRLTMATPDTAFKWTFGEARACPSPLPAPGKRYEWNTHIVSINNVDTGVFPNTTWP